MIIRCSDLTFRELEEADIEAVRMWRNSDFVRLNMKEQAWITAEAQAAWYRTISKGQHWYFIILKEAQPIGVANFKDIDERSRSAEAGLFMIHEQYADGVHPMTCSAMLIHLAFDYLNLDVVYSTSIISSPHAERFNIALGSIPISKDHQVIRWRTDAPSALQSKERILNLLKSYNKLSKPMEIILIGVPNWPVKPFP